ncbi:MAG: division plane positioning ATPase MipZ [Xanthobacteraceae bacterium]
MTVADHASAARVVVVGNEKGGSGKSTIAMHIVVALMKSGERVGTLDLDSRQRTFTHYIENRYDWAQYIGRQLEIPDHLYFVESADDPTAEAEAADGEALADQIKMLAGRNTFIVIDTPGRDSHLGRLAHSLADILITPLNDSFVDLDVFGTVDRQTLSVTGTSHYAQMVGEALCQRRLRGNGNADWIVLRNRLSMLNSRNTSLVGAGLLELSNRLGFRLVEGLAERVIFREFYPRGLTALDALDEVILGARSTSSHAAARLEIENLLGAMKLRGEASGERVGETNLNAA